MMPGDFLFLGLILKTYKFDTKYLFITKCLIDSYMTTVKWMIKNAYKVLYYQEENKKMMWVFKKFSTQINPFNNLSYSSLIINILLSTPQNNPSNCWPLLYKLYVPWKIHIFHWFLLHFSLNMNILHTINCELILCILIFLYLFLKWILKTQGTVLLLYFWFISVKNMKLRWNYHFI